MKHAIRELTGCKTLTSEVLDAFMKKHEFPVAEGDTVTFVYRGAADRVNLRHWIYGLPSSPAFQRLGDTDLWYVTVELPPESRVEYKIEVIEGGESHWILDPLNPHQAHDPFGSNSVCHGDGYTIPEWALPDPEARTGKIEELEVESKALGSTRRVRVYLPARFRERARYPLLVVHDGDDYLNYSGFRTVLDNLIHRLEIPPMVVAFTNPGDRLVEYAANRDHARHIVEELVPDLEDRYPLFDRPSARGIMGASFGAIASFSTAWFHPGFFGLLLTQSGSFGFTDIGGHAHGPAYDPVVEFMNAYRQNPGKPVERLFVTCGVYESLIYENRSMLPLFQRTGMEVRYVEARDGHNWENWRDRLREALSWLFPGPLWMVYE